MKPGRRSGRVASAKEAWSVKCCLILASNSLTREVPGAMGEAKGGRYQQTP